MTTTPAATPAAASTPPKVKGDGGYLVLRKDDVPGDWAVVQTSSAKSAAAAVREVVGKLSKDQQDGIFVAIPARSWRPVTVSAKTETKLVVTEAKP